MSRHAARAYTVHVTPAGFTCRLVDHERCVIASSACRLTAIGDALGAWEAP